ncbi:hypothetical protein [Komagataeibacter europaeus]|uniref:hypothetical protein n=1 Tax=Komagataeibacter europaeus TaxID=33995 RepID=UPI001E466ACE|nr:hypothetical protein [Komagataeibacter europaeus]
MPSTRQAWAGLPARAARVTTAWKQKEGIAGQPPARRGKNPMEMFMTHRAHDPATSRKGNGSWHR